MSGIRRQSILSSFLIYIGFVVGAVNTYLFAKEGIFKPEEYGLVQAFISTGLVFFALSNMGSNYIMARLYPYYYDELKKKDNDLLALCFTISMIGFVLLCTGAWILKPLMIRKFTAQSQLLVHYFYWILPFTFFFIIFFLLSSQSSINKKTVLPLFLQETGFRVFTSLLILCKLMNLISFDLFIKLFAFSYLALAIVLGIYLKQNGLLLLRFKISAVTRSKLKTILSMISLIYGAGVLLAIAQNIESFTISSKRGLADNGIYQFSNYIAAVIAVPQRAIAPIASAFIAQAWKDNNLAEINRIYRRSSINLLLAGLFIFINIWLNIDAIYEILKVNSVYEAGKWVVLILGIKFIVDLGTGVNSQLLQTSPSWKVELITNAALFLLAIPLNIYMTGKYGIVGAAIASCIYLTLYNFIRLAYIKYRYNLFPFDLNTAYAIICALICYLPSQYLFRGIEGWGGVMVKSALFSLLFFSGIYFFKLTPDFHQVLDNVKKRLGMKTE